MDFKSLREDKLGLTQEQFAETYSVDIATVQEWDNSNKVSSDVIEAILDKTGMTPNDVYGYKKPEFKKIEVNDTWNNMDVIKNSITNHIKKSLDSRKISIEHREKYIHDFLEGLSVSAAKPMIMIAGRSDVGKSTLINSLIGMKKMPVSWTPTTSIAVYIKHIKERPEFIKDNVWIFKDKCDGENIWDIKRLHDKDYCEKWKIASGKIDILMKFGTRQGGHSEKNVGAAVIFIDAPILLNCDIVDLPGYGTEKEKDDIITFKTAQKADILIYLSRANGFLGREEINFLKDNVRNLPIWEKNEENKIKPLANLFVVASQAHTVNNGNQIKLKDVLDKKCKAFNNSLAEDYWRTRTNYSGYQYTEKTIRKRFFTYTTDIPELCEAFRKELVTITEQIPACIEKRTKSFIREYIEARKPNLKMELEKYEGIIEDREKYGELLKRIEESDVKRVADNDKAKENIREKINSLKKDSWEKYSAYYSSLLTLDTIEERIKKNGIKNKKDDIECFASQLQDEMQDKCTKLMEQKSEDLSECVQKYVDNYSKNIQLAFNNLEIDLDFDVSFAFAKALSEIGIFGGLGAFIIGEAAFLLGGIEFIAGIGGGIALGAAVLGPVGLAIGILIAAGLQITKLFGGGWEKKIAQKLIEAYEENRIVEKYKDAIYDYWEKTEVAFDEAADKLEEEWESYVKSLSDMVKEYDIEKIKQNIVSIKSIESFFEHIPL